jgi:glycosyltransferase involved in cell wall biosynthesis
MESISDVELDDAALLTNGFSSYYSSVDLKGDAIAGGVVGSKGGRGYRVVTVGSLAQLYKGTDILIEAIARCVATGLDVTAVVVGDGGYRPKLEALAERLGVASRISFAGQVTAGKAVRDILDTADLFVLPSRTEGLPRALIEAMARGLPCIGSAVGGIPELLDASELTPVGDAVALAAKIQEVLGDRSRKLEMSTRNLARSMRYLGPVLAERRRLFYRRVREATEAWEAQHSNLHANAPRSDNR